MHKIMVVDDEAVITTRLEERLTSMGYEVVGKASSAKASISMAKRLRPDLILMDIVLPGKSDGIDASEKIKAELDIPIIFLTAYANDKFIKRAKKVEPYGYIVKPFQEKEIKAVIEVALHKKDMERKRSLDLKEEIAARKLIEKAKGILIDRHKISEKEAMRQLQKESRRQNKKIKEIAQGVISSELILN